MSDKDKLAILSAISASTTPAKPERFSFNSLSKSLSLSKDELDLLLLDLSKSRFVTQYAKKGVDGFTVVISQKGLDAIEDESFI
jgi:RIO-like serine/threonine protein kinase